MADQVKAKKKAPAKKAGAKKKAATKKRVTKAKPMPVKRRVVLRSEDLMDDSDSAIEMDTPAAEPEVAAAPAPRSRSAASALRSASVVQEALTSRATRGVRERDVTAFVRQLIMMLNAGTPILKSLTTLSQRGERRGIRNLVAGIAEFVGAGNPLWQAFARESKYFSPVEVHLIKAGEASGNLVEVLTRIVAYRDKRDSLHRFMRNAMIYPVILVVVSCVVIIVLAKFVIPMFREFFETMGAEIPRFASVLMGTAEYIARTWWMWGIGFLVVLALYKWWVTTPAGRLISDRIKLRIPLVSSIVRKRTVAEFTRTFSLLLRSGISMMATLDLCRNSVRNQAYVSVMQDMRDSVESGEGLESPLRDGERRGLLPGVVVDMLLTGEETGSIDTIAEQVADIYDDEVESAVAALKEAIGPIAVLLFGGIVAMLVASIFLPLIGMIGEISGGSM